MPTQRPRVTVTETDALAHRLDLAAAAFPERASSRSELLLALTEVAERELEAQGEDNRRARRRTAKARVLELTLPNTGERAEALTAQRDRAAGSDAGMPHR